MIDGFRYLETHLSEKGFYAESIEISEASKNKIIAKVPYSNSEIDFSEVFGAQPYNDRTVTASIHLINSQNLSDRGWEAERMKLVNWLMDSHGRQPLCIDTIPGYYLLGEIRDQSKITVDDGAATISVVFSCYPFFIKNDAEGSDIWDNFNFETDIAQKVHFDIDGSVEITLYNVGINYAIPQLSIEGKIVIAGKEYVTGLYQDVIKINSNSHFTFEAFGQGSIDFIWNKEVL